MRGIKSKGENKWKKITAFCALFLLLVILINSTRRVYEKKVEAQKKLVQMQKEVQTLEDRQIFLKKDIQKLETRDGVAYEMRKKLNVAEAGESVAVIVESPEATSTPVVKVSGWKKFKSFWTNIFR